MSEKRVIQLDFNRNMNTKLPPLKRVEPIKTQEILEHNQRFMANMTKTDVINETTSKQQNEINQNDANTFLDDLFVRAFNLSTKNQKQDDFCDMNYKSIGVGIELPSNGMSNTRIGFSDFSSRNDMIDAHIGNLNSFEYDNVEDMKFAKMFQCALDTVFNCFGKNYDELDSQVIAMATVFGIQVNEQNQKPTISFDENRSFPVEKIVEKYFEYILKPFESSMYVKKISDLNILYPANYNTTQKTMLREVLNNLSIKKCSLTDKCFGIVPSLLPENDETENSKSLIINLNSGFMNMTCVSIENQKDVTVEDRLIDDKISQEQLLQKILSFLKSELKQKNVVLDSDKELRDELDKALAKYVYSDRVVPVTIKNVTIDLNVKNFNVDLMTEDIKNVLLKASYTTDKGLNESIDTIAICSNALISSGLTSKLEKLFPKAKFKVFNDANQAVRGTLDTKKLKEYNKRDLLPHSIGLCVYNGTIKRLLGAGDYYPCSECQEFLPIKTEQTQIVVCIYEGESVLARNCKPIGEFIVPEIKPNTKYSITFIVDANGVLQIEARNSDILLKSIFSIYNYEVLFKDKPDLNFKNYANYVDSLQDLNLFNTLDHLDVFINYIQCLVRDEKFDNINTVKVLLTKAKAYISNNRLKIGMKECELIKNDLESCIGSEHTLNFKKEQERHLSIHSVDAPEPFLPAAYRSKSVFKKKISIFNNNFIKLN